MRIQVTVKPNSKHREEVVPQDDGTLTVYTKALAVDNKANTAVVRLLAKHFGVGKSAVSLVGGRTSKRKIFEVEE